MSDGQVFGIILSGVAFVSLGLPLIFIFFHEIIDFFERVINSFVDAIKAPFEKHKYNKQMNCFHLWRRLDADYSRSETVYRYRCTKCKSDKRLRESESVRYEKDFMSDESRYYE